MADDEPSVLINYERESIHAGDDPIPLTIEFPARVTITDLLVRLTPRFAVAGRRLEQAG
jgi:hypothetical protein